VVSCHIIFATKWKNPLLILMRCMLSWEPPGIHISDVFSKRQLLGRCGGGSIESDTCELQRRGWLWVARPPGIPGNCRPPKFLAGIPGNF